MVQVERTRCVTPEAWQLLEEYYTAVGVVRQDGARATQQLLDDPRCGLWLASVDGKQAGCVLLKAGVPHAAAGECKRLYVRPAFRRRGVADALMDALEAAARSAGLGEVLLDTNDEFRASIALYRRRGYMSCARYNDNPQATMFFRKLLGA